VDAIFPLASYLSILGGGGKGEGNVLHLFDRPQKELGYFKQPAADVHVQVALSICIN